jgi:ribulose-5-phosphate 4-epimerase/fuculose-1-phosphate aldolase
MKDVPYHVLEEFVQTCRMVAERGLVRCSSGNLSRRLDDQRMLATATRSWMGQLSRDQVSLSRISDGMPLDGPEPTVEIGFHSAILRRRPDVSVVLHYQTTCATALACQSGEDINYYVIPEIPYYIGKVARVPYLPPGSEDLARKVADAMQEHDMVVMRNHGLVTVAGDYAHAIQNAEFFELACEIIVRGGEGVRPLSQEAASRLLTAGESEKVRV